MAKTPEVTEDLMRSVAHLARLELTDDEACTFTPQLRKILQYMESLQDVDVAGVEPLTHPLDFPETPMREDVIRPSPRDAEGHPKVIASAPEAFEDGFKVPQIL